MYGIYSDDPNVFVRVYGYTQGCEACDKLKDLLFRHNITYTFIPVGRKGSDCAHRKWVVSQGHDTVPQVWMDSTYLGNYGTLKAHLEPQETANEVNSLLGWLPTPAPKLTEPATAKSEAVETETPGASKTAEVSKAERKTPREDDVETRVEACFINPLTGQRECS